MNRYNALIKNDITNGEGVSVSFFVQGCPHKCSGCFNPETWDYMGGEPYTEHTKKEIIDAIGANGIERNFSLLGGEPLDPVNLTMTEDIVSAVRIAYPNIKIFLWTGYNFEELPHYEPIFHKIFECVDIVIDGPFKEDLKDLDLKLRGSSNQNIWAKNNGLWRKTNG